ncbi:MAG TPA: hypothetical protein VNX28_06440 [Gemmataceae bacterium]|nr:hypothetical protein [Gemmataceae bacterium]
MAADVPNLQIPPLLDDPDADGHGVSKRRRRALVIIWALTHLNELARVVRLLEQDSHWQAVVMFGIEESATDDVKVNWTRAGIPWFVFHTVPATGQSGPRAAPWIWFETALTWLVLALFGMLCLVGSLLLFLPTACIQLLYPTPMKARTRKLRQYLSGRVPRRLESFCVALVYPSWELAGRMLKNCPHTSVLAIAGWVFLRLIHKVLLLDWLLDYRRQLRALGATVERARGIWAELKPDLIILAEDNVSYPTGVFIKVARESGAASVVIPYTLASTKEFVEGFRNPACDARRLCNWLVARSYPHWCRFEQGRGLLRLPGRHVLAMEKLGIAPEHPWIPNDGRWDAFAVESPRMLERYVQEFGMQPERLALTGAMSDDTLFAARRQAGKLKEQLYRELALPPGRPLVLLAFPPDQFPSRGTNLEFADYEEMACFLIESCHSLAGYNFVVTLHPRISDKARRHIESLGAKVCKRDTLELVPLCDVYVASVSATIRWAIACGIPVINYDIFHYHYDDYDSAAGVVTIQTKSEWLGLLGELNQRPAWIAEWSARQETCAARWGMVDGKSGRRLLELFDNLTKQGRPTTRAAIPASPSRSAA